LDLSDPPPFDFAHGGPEPVEGPDLLYAAPASRAMRFEPLQRPSLTTAEKHALADEQRADVIDVAIVGLGFGQEQIAHQIRRSALAHPHRLDAVRIDGGLDQLEFFLRQRLR
jgi:hypothetical protein